MVRKRGEGRGERGERRKRGGRREKGDLGKGIPGDLLVEMFLHLLEALPAAFTLLDGLDVLLEVGDLVVSIPEHLRVLFHLFLTVRKYNKIK